MTETQQTGDLRQLVALFHEPLTSLGQFTQVAAHDVPSPYDRLLVHQHHMTVTVERYYGAPVELQVVQHRTDGELYAREILLKLDSTGQVVQYGIVQLAPALLPPEVRSEIEQRGTPLGRILIQHELMRQVELNAIWHVQPSPQLGELLQLSGDPATYGRSAVIHVDGQPVIRLLEIVTPVLPSNSP